MSESTNVFNRMVAVLLAPLTDLLFDKHVDIMLEMAIFHLATWHKLTLEMARAQMQAALVLESSVVDPPVELSAARVVEACALAHVRLLLVTTPYSPPVAAPPAPPAVSGEAGGQQALTEVRVVEKAGGAKDLAALEIFTADRRRKSKRASKRAGWKSTYRLPDSPPDECFSHRTKGVYCDLCDPLRHYVPPVLSAIGTYDPSRDDLLAAIERAEGGER